MASFSDNLHDPVLYAIPVFALSWASSALDALPRGRAGRRRVRTPRHPDEPAHGRRSLVVNGTARVVALLAYARCTS